MKARDVYFKTMKFVWAKLALGGAIFLFALLTFAISVGLGSLFGGSSMGVFLWIWLILVLLVYAFVNRYIGYLLKAGHVAVVTTAVTTGSVPDNQLQAGKEMVEKRFATANVYFALDGLVSGAVRQLQNGLGKIENIFGNIPGVSALVNFAQLFIGIALGYIDECCLGYTFLHNDQSAFKSAADGVVIYFQNWKKLLKSAAITTLIVLLVSFLAWLVPFLLLAGLFKTMEVSFVFAFLLALMCSAIIKSAFVDSYMMVKMMVAYMEEAPYTVITFDLYGKLCKLSAKFRKLFDRGQAEQKQYYS